MDLVLMPLRPAIGVIVVTDIAEDRSRSLLEHDNANVAINAYRPHSLVAPAVNPMERQTWSAWVSHIVEDNLIRCRLLEPAQPAEAAIEGLRNLKHGLSSRKTKSQANRFL